MCFAKVLSTEILKNQEPKFDVCLKNMKVSQKVSLDHLEDTQSLQNCNKALRESLTRALLQVPAKGEITCTFFSRKATLVGGHSIFQRAHRVQ